MTTFYRLRPNRLSEFSEFYWPADCCAECGMFLDACGHAPLEDKDSREKVYDYWRMVLVPDERRERGET